MNTLVYGSQATDFIIHPREYESHLQYGRPFTKEDIKFNVVEIRDTASLIPIKGLLQLDPELRMPFEILQACDYFHDPDSETNPWSTISAMYRILDFVGKHAGALVYRAQLRHDGRRHATIHSYRDLLGNCKERLHRDHSTGEVYDKTVCGEGMRYEIVHSPPSLWRRSTLL
jgi:hypothetical protein